MTLKWTRVPLWGALAVVLSFPQLLGGAEQAVKGKTAMVASAHPLASEAAIGIIKKGGNVVDAAVAAAFSLGVVEPHASGIAGGGFMVIYLAQSRRLVVIDYRETAPAKAVPDLYGTPGVVDQMKMGSRSVAVPATLAGLNLALQKLGTLGLKEVLAPAIRIAEEGFPVSRVLSAQMALHADDLALYPESSAVFLKNGKPYREGEKIFLRDLAKTYRRIGDKGAEIFYRGEIADALVKATTTEGQEWISKKDLAGYRPLEREPLRMTYRGLEILSAPPPAGAAQIGELLNILEGYPAAGLKPTAAGIHLLVEAQKRVLGDRAQYFGDPAFTAVPVRGLLSKEYAASLRKGISPGRITPTFAAGDPRPYEPGRTTHIAVADWRGNVVGISQTINSFFGSGIVVPGTGILLNNEMKEFASLPGLPNSFAPGKRPMSSMAPLVVLKNGRPYLTLGSGGATRITSAMAQVLRNMIDHKMDLQQAIDAPRVHWNEELFIESRIPEKVQKALTAMGYPFTVKEAYDFFFGGVQAIQLDVPKGLLTGAADPRRHGKAAGY